MDNTFKEYLKRILSADLKIRSVNKNESGTFSIATTRGVVRKENQDRLAVFNGAILNPFKANVCLTVLADGMGGMIEGSTCAELTISTFITSLLFNQPDNIIEKMRVAALDANKIVHNKYKGEGGSTLSAYLIMDNIKIALNVGDSRIYNVDNANNLKQLSSDDTLESKIKEYNDERIETSTHNYGQLIQYIGMGNFLEPHVINVDENDNTKFVILTSDGAHSLPFDTFTALVANAPTTEEITKRVIFTSEWFGGEDNASIAVISSDVLYNTADMNTFEIITPTTKAYYFLNPDNMKQDKINEQQARSNENINEEEKPKKRKRKERKVTDKEQIKLQIDIKSDDTGELDIKNKEHNNEDQNLNNNKVAGKP